MCVLVYSSIHSLKLFWYFNPPLVKSQKNKTKKQNKQKQQQLAALSLFLYNHRSVLE